MIQLLKSLFFSVRIRIDLFNARRLIKKIDQQIALQISLRAHGKIKTKEQRFEVDPLQGTWCAVTEFTDGSGLWFMFDGDHLVQCANIPTKY